MRSCASIAERPHFHERRRSSSIRWLTAQVAPSRPSRWMCLQWRDVALTRGLRESRQERGQERGHPPNHLTVGTIGKFRISGNTSRTGTIEAIDAHCQAPQTNDPSALPSSKFVSGNHPAWRGARHRSRIQDLDAICAVNLQAAELGQSNPSGTLSLRDWLKRHGASRPARMPAGFQNSRRMACAIPLHVRNALSTFAAKPADNARCGPGISDVS